MDNENKELQNSPTEAELEEKVLQDVSEKIRDAAAELEDEIAEAEEMAEEVSGEENEAIEEEEDGLVLTGYDEEGNPIYMVTEEAYVKEPKVVSVRLLNMLLYLFGAAVVGALLFFAISAIPGWLKTGGSSAVPATAVVMDGKKVLSVGGEKLSDKELEYYIYKAAEEFFNENRGVISDISEYDWSTKMEKGKTAGTIVKERAVEMAIEDILVMKAGKGADIYWDKDMENQSVNSRVYVMNKEYGEELVLADILAQGYADLDVYKRLYVRQSYVEAIQKDLGKNPDNYFPKDLSVLKEFASKDSVSVKHILIMHDQMATVMGGEDADTSTDTDAKKTLAKKVLAMAKKGEDFDDLIEKYGEDGGQPKEGYTFGPGEMVEEFEKAAFDLKVGEISGVVESPYGYHIIKRIPGKGELMGYWKKNARIKTNDDIIRSISVKEIVGRAADHKEDFNDLFEEYQEENGMAY